MIARRHLLAALPWLGACGRAGTGFRGHAFIACAGSSAIAVADLLAFTVRERIELPGPPASLFRHNGRLFVVIPSRNLIEEIEPARRRPVARHRLPGPPLAARPEPGAPERLWVLLNDPRPLLHPVALTSAPAPRPIPLAGPASGVAFAPGDARAAVTLQSGAVQFVRLDQGRAHPPTPLAPGLGETRFRSDGRMLMVAERERRRLTFLDTGSRGVLIELPLPLVPENFCVNADGGQLFITGEGRDAVVIVYPYRTEIAQTSLSGRRPGRMAAALDPPYLFVSNPDAGSVTVFDIQTQKVVAVTSVGVRPAAIAITPDQQYALVLNEDSGDVAVIRIAAISPGRAKRAPLFTMIPAGDRPVDLRILPA